MFEEARPQSTLDINQSSQPQAEVMEEESLLPLQLHQIAQLNPEANLKIEHQSRSHPGPSLLRSVMLGEQGRARPTPPRLLAQMQHRLLNQRNSDP